MKGKFENLIGQRFGRLVVLRDSQQRKNGCVIWECQCDCGKTTYVVHRNLINGNTTSCGCLRSELASQRKKKDLTGQRFGHLTVLRDTGERKNKCIVWECRCDCGNITYVRSISLTSGNTTSCGCFRLKKWRSLHCEADPQSKANICNEILS